MSDRYLDECESICRDAFNQEEGDVHVRLGQIYAVGIFGICEAKRLRAQVERMREALQPFATTLNPSSLWRDDTDLCTLRLNLTVGDLRKARAALQEPQERT